MSITKKYLRVAEMSEKLGLSPSTIRKYVQLGKIPHIKIERTLLFDEEEIDNWVNSKKVNTK